MKKIFILFLLFYISGSLTACDYCNCYLGLNPHFKKNIIGLRYHYLFYRGSHEQDFVLQEAGLTKNDFWEVRTMLELHGQWYPLQKLQLLFYLPYIYNSEHRNPPAYSENTNSSVQINSGISDPVLIAHYQLFNKSYGDTVSKYSHRLLAGGGIKIPAGKWRLEHSEEPIERIHLPGTGAVDYLASILYIGSYKKMGLNINASYLLTTANSEHFRFGNIGNANVLVYYTSRIYKFHFYPDIGMYFEHAQKDKYMNEETANSGGTVLFAHSGADFYYHKLSLNLAAQIPVMQSLNENQPHIKFRFIAGINFAF